jgi:GAF domain-containing protein
MTSSSVGDPSFDRYARMVRRALSVPVALVTFVEEEQQVFAGSEGLTGTLEQARSTPISHSICQYVVADDAPLVVPDTAMDELLRDHPAVRDLDVQAYAGWPITDHRGATIGSLCALDHAPHAWTREELDSLADLAAACSAEIAQRQLRVESDLNQVAAERLTARSEALLALSLGLADVSSLSEVASTIERVALRELGCKRAGLWVDSALLEPTLTGEHYSGPHGRQPHFLTFVPNAEVSWRAAEVHAEVAVDPSHPVTACVAERAPCFFTSFSEQDARFPEVPATPSAGQARAFLPLSVRRQLLGALVLTWERERDFSSEERATVTALAAYTAQAVSRCILVEERLQASRTLQGAMLTELPQPDDLELAARYRPASLVEQVGGDWYDAVLLPSGCTAVAIGDVVGHDMVAAADMSQVRSVLRGLAWATDDSPAATVATLDRALPGLGISAIASLVFARVEQTPAQRAAGSRTLRWTNAGHPPPLLIDATGDASWLVAERSEPLLGVEPAHFRLDNAVTVAAGSTLLLYTDGLVERRGEHLEDGLERLRTLVAGHAGEPLDAMLDRILSALLDDHLSDDVALLGVRFHTQDGAHG